MIKRLLWALLVAAGLGAPLVAQQLDYGTITANSSGGACTGTANSCTSFLPSTATSVTLQVTGTFVGTLTFEASSDAAQTNWFTVTGTNLVDGSTASTTTTTGQFAFNNSGFTGLRARATAWTSGTATVTAARGYAIARWLTPFFNRTLVGNGTVGAPSYSFLNDSTAGLYRAGAADIRMSISGADVFQFTAGLATAPAAFRAGTFRLASTLLMSSTTPTISSGFGTGPSIVTSNGSATFRVNVGTGGVATSGVVGMQAATTGWNCTVIDITNNNVTRQTADTTNTVTVTAAAAWAASDILLFQCFAY